MRSALVLVLLVPLLAGCRKSVKHHASQRASTSGAPVAAGPPRKSAMLPPLPPLEGPPAELGESWPLETTLDHADIPDAADVWLEMVTSAQRTIDFAEFYASDQEGTRLHGIIEAVEAAAGRGVVVRFLAEEAFAQKYPETLQRLAKTPGIYVRRFDRGKAMGGILHAKYFVVDGREAWLGSQNFDWRSLEHIQELGARMREPSLVKALAELYDADWDVVGGAGDSRYEKIAWPKFPVQVGPLSLTLAASPKDFLGTNDAWDLPIILRWLDEAKKSIKVQVLTYKTKSRDGSTFEDLDDALRSAAKRGVKVHLLVSSWAAKEKTVAALVGVPNLEVGVITIPPWSGGEVPFGRVVHAKFLTVDGRRAWVGTSNWEGDYFTKSRNVSLFVEGNPFAAQVERVFDGDAASAYTKPFGR